MQKSALSTIVKLAIMSLLVGFALVFFGVEPGDLVKGLGNTAVKIYEIFRGFMRDAMKYEDAYRGYETVVGMKPEGNPELQAFDQSLFQLGMLDLQMGATERAVQFFEALLQTVPDHPEAHLALGQALMKLGREEEARDQVEIHQRLEAQRSADPAGQASR